LRRLYFSSGLYEYRLKGRHPLKLLGTPTDVWPGSMTAGTHLLAGKFFCSGQTLKNPNHDEDQWAAREIWAAAAAPEAFNERWLEYLHSFCWLRDLNRVVDRRAARHRAIDLLKAWLNQNDHWSEMAWRVDILARRIVNIMAYAPLVFETEDLVYRSRLLNSLARQARHLYHMSDQLPPGPAGLQALFGLIEAGLYIPHGDGWLNKALSLLAPALQREILKDGGVLSRNPMDQHRLLRDILRLKASFEDQAYAVPTALQSALDRMVPILRALTHGDGRLALFNGAYEQGESDVEATLKAAGLVGIIQEDSRESGFRRLSSGKTILIVDAGPPAPRSLSRNCHAGSLSFEMSRGPERIIVNCGNATYFPDQEEGDLFEMSRKTAAHSTLVIDDKNSSEIGADGLIARGPERVMSHRSGERGHILLEMSHDGYQKRFGVLHQRSLYMDDSGEDIRGEDILRGRAARTGTAFKIRFHLHPDVNASPASEEGGILLRLKSGEIWQFLCSGATADLQESLYLGTRGRFSQTRQIVLRQKISTQETVVKWSLHRLESIS